MIIDTIYAADESGFLYIISVDQDIRDKGSGSKMSQIFGKISYFDQFGHTVVPIAGQPDQWEIVETGVRVSRAPSDDPR